MGDRLMMLVTHHGGLPGNAFKVLNRMAALALEGHGPDGRATGIYSDGWENLAHALGRPIPAEDRHDYRAMATRKARADATSAAVAVLVRAGLVVRVGPRPRGGVTATYVLNPDPAPAGVDQVDELAARRDTRRARAVDRSGAR